MKLYGRANTRSLRAAWALEEAGVEYEYATVDLFKGEGRSPAFLAINPAGKIPVLVDGDLVLTESFAIVTYVGERFPASGLVPADPAARADCLRWCSFVVTELEQPLWTLVKHRFALPPEHRLPAIEDTARWEFARAKDLFERALGGREFILPGGFSGADIFAAHTLAWAKSARIPLDSQRLEAYMTRLAGRPACARAREREARHLAATGAAPQP